MDINDMTKGLMDKEKEITDQQSELHKLFFSVKDKPGDEKYIKLLEEFIAFNREYRACTNDIIDINDRYMRINICHEEGIEPPTEEDYNRCMSYDLHDRYEEVMAKINKYKEEEEE